MVTYRGVVRDGVVVLPEDVHLEDGREVEVYVLPAGSTAPTEEERERLFKEQLIREGFLAPRAPVPPDDQDDDDFEPIEVAGTPLSQMIIEERR
jgi:hypothetical protein